MPILEKIFRDNPNPKAKIGFVIFYPFQFYVFKNVYKHMPEDSEFIVDFGAFFPIEQPADLAKDIISLLNKNRVYYRILNYEDYYFNKYLDSFFSKYEGLVSLWETGCLMLDCNCNKRKIHLTYGAGKDLVTYGVWKRIFDLILAYGRRDYKLFSLYTESKIVGNPKFDDWFNDDLDKGILDRIKERIDVRKKTVLYLPTHGDLCSIDSLSDEIKKLSKIYNVIVKLHYFTVREERERIKKITDKRILILKDDVDLLPLLKISNIVLSDNSSAIFDVILADKPIIATDFHSKEFLDVEHRKLKYLRRGRHFALTYSNSIEERIKKNGLIITIKNPGELAKKVEKAMEDEQRYKDARKKLREKLFCYNDGKCGKRAAEEIKKFMEKELPPKPFLYHALENFLTSLERYPLEERKKNLKRIEECENAIFKKLAASHNLKFSVIITGNYLHASFLKITLKSLFLQNIPKNNFEIILPNNVPRNIVSEIQKEIAKNNFDFPRINYSEIGVSDIKYIKNSFKKCNGEIICFIKSGCLAHSDWLLKIYLVYEKYPSIAGVGGYLLKPKNIYEIYDEYYYLEIGKKLNLWKEPFYMKKIYETKNSMFFQNPAGSLSNVSYKKEAIENTNLESYSRLPELFEMELKKDIIKDYEICFSNIFISDFRKTNFSEFIRKNFNEGIAYALFCIKYPSYKKHYHYSLAKVFKLSFLNILDGFSKIKLTFVIFIGSLFRLFGKWYIKTNYQQLGSAESRESDFNFSIESNSLTPTKISFGKGKFNIAKKYLDGLPTEKNCILVLSGNFLKNNKKISQYVDEWKLNKKNIKIIISEKFPATSQWIEEKSNEMKGLENISSVIGMGGGAVMDAAKILSVCITCKKPPLELIQSKEKLLRNMQLILIPTTSGTGAELSKGAVMIDCKKGVRVSFYEDVIFPDQAIIDPLLALGCANETLKDNVFDALSHAIETYVSRRSNKITKDLSVKCIKIILSYQKYIKECFLPYEIQEKISLAGSMGGINLNLSSVCLPHIMSHALPKEIQFNFSHAKITSIFYNAWLNNLEIKNPEIIRSLDEELSFSFIKSIKHFLKDTYGAYTLEKIGFEKNKKNFELLIERLEKHLDNDPSYNNKEDLLKILKNS